MRRAIQRQVEDPVSEKLLHKEFTAGQIIVVDVEPDPENPDENIAVFKAVEGFIPPDSPAEMVAGDVAGDVPESGN